MKRAFFALCALITGCASAPATPPVSATSAARSETAAAVVAVDEEEREQRTMRIEGLTGSLPMQEVRRVLEPRSPVFAECFLARSRRLSQLSGGVRLFIRVATDGSVERAFPEDSTLGDRETERCLTDVARDTRFPRPRGGAAEVRWPLHIDPAGRHPETWDEGRVARIVERRGADAMAQCLPAGQHGDFQVTAYVRGSGRVLAAGVAVTDEALVDAIDCVHHAVGRWRMPPTRHTAKVTFVIHG